MAAIEVDRSVAAQILVDYGVSKHRTACILALLVVTEHETLPGAIDEICAETHERIEPLRGKSLRRQRRLDRLHIGQRGARVIAHRVRISRVVREVPAVE